MPWGLRHWLVRGTLGGAEGKRQRNEAHERDDDRDPPCGETSVPLLPVSSARQPSYRGGGAFRSASGSIRVCHALLPPPVASAHLQVGQLTRMWSLSIQLSIVPVITKSRFIGREIVDVRAVATVGCGIDVGDLRAVRRPLRDAAVVPHLVDLPSARAVDVHHRQPSLALGPEIRVERDLCAVG